MTWKIVVHATAEKELDEQPSEIRGKLDQLVSLIETFGLERVPAKYARHLQDDLWEFRLIGKDGIAPSTICHQPWSAHRRRKGLHQEDTEDAREIKIALKRARDIQ